jgi:hypothetical protein
MAPFLLKAPILAQGLISLEIAMRSVLFTRFAERVSSMPSFEQF